MIVGADRISEDGTDLLFADLVTAVNAGGAAVGVTAGTVAASKGVVVDANKAIDGITITALKLGASGSGVTVTATAGELNKLHGAPLTVTQVSTPATGSNGTQFTFKDAAGVAVTVPVAGMGFLSSSATGLTPVAADTSIATLTNGHLVTCGATASVGPFFQFVTTAAGLLGITTTAVAGTYYLCFVLPNGKLACSTAITIN